MSFKACCEVRFQIELRLQFEIQSGLKPGDAMSPIPFNPALEKVTRAIAVADETELNGENVTLAYESSWVFNPRLYRT